MLKFIAIAVVLLLAVVLVYAATRPAAFSVERSISIQAPPARVFGLVSDFHSWLGWSPWEKMDPALQRQYSGAASGLGAVYAWQGNAKVGKGRMEIVELHAPERIRIRLDFYAPFAASNTAEFSFVPQGETTTVRWVMTGRNHYVAKLMQLFFNMDRMVGTQFESGLAELRRLAEAPPAP